MATGTPLNDVRAFDTRVGSWLPVTIQHDEASPPALPPGGKWEQDRNERTRRAVFSNGVFRLWEKIKCFALVGSVGGKVSA
jgi:hypothetical protein